jgi:hypothetical protein
MDYFYDGQIRRYVTQFMRIFIGFKYQDGDRKEKVVPVMYGDLTRQVASIIKENSENKLPSVPRIACYITGFEMDTDRLSDATYVSKLNIRERAFNVVDGQRQYTNEQGAGYTVERLMPTPFMMTVKTDIWTSNTDQKLQLFEQIMTLFNPSLELQTTDNYVDWTSISTVYLKDIGFTSRSIPVGTESDIDILSLTFEIPIWISPPTKVKKLGIVRAIVSNIFTDTGDAKNLQDLIYNESSDLTVGIQVRRYGIIVLSAANGNPNDFYISAVDVGQAVLDAGLTMPPEKIGKKLDWAMILEQYGGFKPGVSRIYLTQPNGNNIIGTFAVNPLDPTTLILSIDPDTVPSNTLIFSKVFPNGKGTIDAIINPYSFNPINTWGSKENFPLGLRYLMLDDVNTSPRQGDFIREVGETDSSRVPYDGPDAWKNLNDSDPIIYANSIIEWDGAEWATIFRLDDPTASVYVTNLRTCIQYKWDGAQWLKSFEGEYPAGTWRIELDP